MGRRTLIIGAALACASGTAAAQQLIATDPVDAVLVASDEGRDVGPMPLTGERLTVAIDGQHATTTMLQAYRNQTGRVVEGSYRLRAGMGARVEAFAYWNGEDKIVGEVFEKQAARRIYDGTVSQRRDPGLLDVEGEGVFGFKIFPIQADEEKRIEVRYSRWLERSGNTIRYRGPAARSDAEIVVTIESGSKIKGVSSTTHELATEKLKSGGTRVRAKGLRKDAKGGELVLTWELDEKAWTPSAYVHWDGEHDGYFAVALPAPIVAESTIPKDVTIVLDRSGSMAGAPLTNAQAAAISIVRMLGKNDRINVIGFSDEVDGLFETPKPATEEIQDQAVNFVMRMRDGGGTDIALALRTALAAQLDDERPRVVIFMTDGQSDAKKAIEAAQADKRDVRVFTVGLGDGVARPLLGRIASIKRGRFTFIAGAEAIQEDVTALYAQISRPLLLDLSLGVDGATAARTYPRTLPDLFAEDQVLVVGRLRGQGKITFTLQGILEKHEMRYSASIDLRGPVSRPWVGRLWAQQRVDHLLEEIALDGANTELSEEVIDLALAYNFVTPYTSFLAIPESEIDAAVRETVMTARERKRRVMEKNPDAAVLDRVENDETTRIVAQHAAPSKDAPAPDPGYDDDTAEGEASSGEAMTRYRKKGGCAGCAAASPGDAAATGAGLVLLGLLLAVVTRRRRRR